MNDLKSHLELLAQVAQSQVSEVAKDISNDLIHEPVMVWKFEKFNYSENGIDTGTINGSPSGIPSWNKAIVGIYNRLLTLPEYNQALLNLDQFKSNSFNPLFSLQMFLFKIIREQIENVVNKKQSSESINSVVNTFIRQITLQQVNAKASVYILGLTLESPSIELAPNIILRQTTIDDLTADTPLQGTSIHDDHQYPTAVLEIKRVVTPKDQNRLAADIRQYIAILQLFGVGGIFRRQTVVATDTLITGLSTLAIHGSRHIPLAVKPFYMQKQVEPRLKAFFEFMQKHMPDLTGHERQMTLLPVSFDRYVDGCHETLLFERKIMNLVMGLEALYVGDNMELSYKLTMRCSKAMSLCGVSAEFARQVLKAAYAIRSTFAHGSHLTNKDMEKYAAQFGSADTLATTIANYLRITLCSYIILSLTKSKLVEDLDKAMLLITTEIALQETFQALTQYLVI